jgi:hypothetical protein
VGDTVEAVTEASEAAGYLARARLYRAATFEELAEAHWELDQAKSAGAPPDVINALAQIQDEALDSFQARYGNLVHSYWASRAPGGAAVTVMYLRLAGPLVRHRSRAQFHLFSKNLRVSDGLEQELFRAERLAAMCEEVLRGPTQRIALTMVLNGVSRALAAIDRPPALGPADEDGAADEDRAEARRRSRAEADNRLGLVEAGIRHDLDRAEQFYRDGSVQSAQYFYFRGMLRGAALIGALAFVVAALLPYVVRTWDSVHIHGDVAAAAWAAATAGALGACVSVMWRMTAGTFRDDAVFGADNLARRGSFRPFLGAMFGLVIYLALKAGILSKTLLPENQNWYFYVFLAFLGGFSERLVPDFLGETEKSITHGKNDSEGDQKPK